MKRFILLSVFGISLFGHAETVVKRIPLAVSLFFYENDNQMLAISIGDDGTFSLSECQLRRDFDLDVSDDDLVRLVNDPAIRCTPMQGSRTRLNDEKEIRRLNKRVEILFRENLGSLQRSYGFGAGFGSVLLALTGVMTAISAVNQMWDLALIGVSIGATIGIGVHQDLEGRRTAAAYQMSSGRFMEAVSGRPVPIVRFAKSNIPREIYMAYRNAVAKAVIEYPEVLRRP